MGHRGTRVLADENTIAAFQAAVDYGLDIFECDPRLTSDGVYVIMHDSTVDRTTDGSGPVSEMTLEQVKNLRTESGYQVPTLEETLNFAREHDMSVYLDTEVVRAHREELEGLSVGKSCVRFKRQEQVPWDTIRAMLVETVASWGSE